MLPPQSKPESQPIDGPIDKLIIYAKKILCCLSICPNHTYWDGNKIVAIKWQMWEEPCDKEGGPWISPSLFELIWHLLLTKGYYTIH